MWAVAIKKKINNLLELDRFEFKDNDEIPTGGYQCTKLHMIFDVKTHLHRKARLVTGVTFVELIDTEVYSSTVEVISVNLLCIIAHQDELKLLCGDVVNGFVTVEVHKKVYCIAGPEFGNKQGMLVVVKRALYV